MGYCYAINPATGREALVCDNCGDCDGTARKRSCPYGYCPAPAICARCWSSPRVRADFRRYHEEAGCAESARKYEERKELERELLERGEYLRSSAIGDGNGIVRVTFRNAAGKELELSMSRERYHSVSLLEPATPSTFGTGLEGLRTWLRSVPGQEFLDSCVLDDVPDGYAEEIAAEYGLELAEELGRFLFSLEVRSALEEGY